jgi:hypothetical protein
MLRDFSWFCLVCYTTSMSIETSTNEVDLQEQADAEAVLRHAFEGQTLDPEVARRVHERAARITEEIRRIHGLIDDDTFHDLLRDDDEP